MKSNYKRLGDYIRQVDVRNRDLAVDRLLGLSITKQFIPSIANTTGTDMSTYKIVLPRQFGYVPVTSRNGDKITIALYEGESPCIISQAYVVFEVIDETDLLPEYLMMWFRRPEFDRYARFKSHGSAREVFEWGEMCEVMLPVPPIEEQRKIVAEYQAIEKRIENNRHLIATLEATAQTIYRKMFVNEIDPENLPEGWRMGTLGNITLFISAGTIPIYTEDSDYLVLGQKCNYNHTISPGKARHHLPKTSSIPCQLGDVLVNSTGDGTLGRVGLIRFEPQKLTFDSNMTLARPLNQEWIEYLFVTMLNMESLFVQICQGSTNQTRLYCSMIRSTMCLIPNNESVMNFHVATKSIFHYQGQLEREINILAETQNNILSKLSKL
ncbi:type I restriction modification DNA specificity domain protein [Parabacteroides distasonis str. 3776 D15 iv]|uniref:Type I restriction modification DNA specificity domain protein n=1 Tax=Parabacteroides distasonis str. 3776 D15 i TaxID=1339342 RepID=A0AB34L9K1_PARDI|nr:restriction endonuclease subunit S [Parabacteroides distasonis]KDS35620.1 type I restriction modification DNA specificity domain protein [Parabacteroides distasonis str. 3776 D15 i]KDS42469.1 type I restriction modification DNA specificity domain protein [Parabacteroides distasonis str. 3776 Po2 i]KDS70723.1 type I restriction modification DNA specificity domain protein [Parabacteroides distasonis str. 3776 D15 iv]UVR25909.1 restriction endonuclease subunit S [Parabacteroides distasonis]